MATKPLEAGERFGRLTLTGRREKRGRDLLEECICECGAVVHVLRGNLRSGSSSSCGCFRREFTAAKNRKHGATGTRLHNIWRGMKQRCTDPGCAAWQYYGGKGIRLCDEWRDFSAFREWALNNGYSPGLTIDRIDSDKGYEPNNCQFISWSENSKRALEKRWQRRVMDVD